VTERDRIERACAELSDYAEALLAAERAADSPGDDLITELLHLTSLPVRLVSA